MDCTEKNTKIFLFLEIFSKKFLQSHYSYVILGFAVA